MATPCTVNSRGRAGTGVIADFLSSVRYEHLVAGITGGVVSTLVLHPFDLVKIRFAVDDGLVSGRPRYSGVLNAFASIARSDGLRGLYRGVTPNVVGAGSSWGLYFFIYGSTKSYIQRGDSTRDIGVVSHLATGCWAGVLTLSVTNPIWVVKTRLCLQYSEPVRGGTHVPQYSGMTDALRQIYRHEGMRGLYKGFVPGIWGVSHGAIQFMTYEQMKTTYNRYKQLPIDAALSTVEYTVFAALSKVVAALTTYPYQVVRARLQDQRGQYRGAVDVVRRTARNEGMVGFYKGLVPNLLRVVPATAITFVLYEHTSRALKNLRPQST